MLSSAWRAKLVRLRMPNLSNSFCLWRWIALENEERGLEETIPRLSNLKQSELIRTGTASTVFSRRSRTQKSSSNLFWKRAGVLHASLISQWSTKRTRESATETPALSILCWGNRHLIIGRSSWWIKRTQWSRPASDDKPRVSLNQTKIQNTTLWALSKSPGSKTKWFYR